MKSKNTRFFISLLCVVVFAIALTFVLENIVPHIVTPCWMWQILLFVIINILVYFVGVKIKGKGDAVKTTNFYTITTVTKLFAFLAILLAYALMFTEDAKPFIITFLIYYFCFTIFETFVKIKINN